MYFFDLSLSLSKPQVLNSNCRYESDTPKTKVEQFSNCVVKNGPDNYVKNDAVFVTSKPLRQRRRLGPLCSHEIKPPLSQLQVWKQKF